MDGNIHASTEQLRNGKTVHPANADANDDDEDGDDDDDNYNDADTDLDATNVRK